MELFEKALWGCDFEIFYERIRWPAISSNQNNGGLPCFEFVSLSLSFIFLASHVDGAKRSRKRLGCLGKKVTAKYFRVIRGNQVVLVWNSQGVSNLYKT